MNYPDDWLCERCCRPFYKHLKVGAKDDELPNVDNWCFTAKDSQSVPEYKWAFKPMDNLTYMEKKAEDKGIIEKNAPTKEPLKD